ncbi:hypothetical protein [Belliella pelovolcani]|uniref:hypothetical protein n=1 Tax=Belliella pelovolcani TaxID=529505 RepID=UPI00391DB4DA
MKKLFYLVAFIAVGFLSAGHAYSSDTLESGDGERWICCQISINEKCTDMYGFPPYEYSERRYGVETCTIYPTIY